MVKSQAYWEKRMTQLFNAQDKQDNQLVSRMSKEYDRTAKAIDKDIASYYAKYGEDDVIEYRKLVIGLSKDERDLLYKNVEAFTEKYPEHADLMPVRKSIYKLNRLEGLQLSARQHLLELGTVEQAEFDKLMTEAYERGYLSTMDGLDNKEAFFQVDDEVMQATLKAGWVDGKNFSDRIWDNKDKLIKTLNNEIRDGLIRGDSYKSMIEALEYRTGVGKNDTKRLVFTESAYILNESNAQAFIDAGIKGYKLTAVLDSKTSKTCRRLDGETFKFSQRVVGLNAPPFHGWCRTTQIPVENDVNSAVDNDIIEEEEFDGNNGGIDEFFNKQNSHSEWKEKLNENDLELIRDYTSADYKVFNLIMREGDEAFINKPLYRGTPLEYRLKETERARALEKTIEGYKAEKPFVTYRSVGGSFDSDSWNSLKPGETSEVFDKGYMSTSLDKKQIENFMGSKSVVYEIHVKQGDAIGAYVGEVSDHINEKEFLIKPNTKFKVIDKRNEQNNFGGTNQVISVEVDNNE